MAKRKLTARIHMLSVREVIAATDADLSDGGGLVLRVKGTGASWVFRYTTATGKRREMGFGICSRQNAQMAGDSIRQARDKAAKARAMLEEVPPRDPIDERARARGEAAEAERHAKAERQARGETLARVAQAYHEKFIEPKLSTVQSVRWINALTKHIPPAIWHKAIRDITRTELLDCLLDLQSGMADTAQRVRRRLDEIYDDATDRGLVTENTVAMLRDKLRRRHVSHPVDPRPSMPFPQISAFVSALHKQEGVAARCLEFVILTAARTCEAIRAPWSEFDLEAGVWTVPAARMKGRETHVVHLVPRVVEILKGQREIGSEWVFPSPTETGKPLSGMAMLMLRKRMGHADITVHGFRATFSTWANETNAARSDVIEACLAHKENDRIRAAYNRATFTEDRRRLLREWATFVAGSNVVAMRDHLAA